MCLKFCGLISKTGAIRELYYWFIMVYYWLWFIIDFMVYYWFDLGNTFGESFQEPLPTNMLVGHVGRAFFREPFPGTFGGPV